ncbi:MAG: hypothetical protein ACMUIP_08980 [bacterium]
MRNEKGVICQGVTVLRQVAGCLFEGCGILLKVYEGKHCATACPPLRNLNLLIKLSIILMTLYGNVR